MSRQEPGRQDSAVTSSHLSGLEEIDDLANALGQEEIKGVYVRPDKFVVCLRHCVTLPKASVHAAN